MHYILESTFARIFLFLELLLLQGASISLENLLPLTSANKRQKEKKKWRPKAESALSRFLLSFSFSLCPQVNFYNRENLVQTE